MVIKGILDPEDARDAVCFGADGIVVSNHGDGGRQLDNVLLGRAFIYALAPHGQRGVENLLNLIEKEMRVVVMLTGAKTIADITQDSLVQANALLSEAGLSPARPRAVR